MIVEFWYKNKKNYFEGFEPKWPKKFENSQMRNVIEFLKNSKFFTKKYILKWN